MKQLTHLSLFSGIGGLDLAAEMAGIKTVGQCEWADYPTKVLEKHWPDVSRWRDIRTLTKESFYEQTGLRTVDVLSGGFPCQPFSVAGKRGGKEDDRYLWPEMLRVIQELKPTWVVGENVPGIINLALDTVLSDLENIGYTSQTFIIPACGVDAPHRRYRVAIMAYSESFCNAGRMFWCKEDSEENGTKRSDHRRRMSQPICRKWREDKSIIDRVADGLRTEVHGVDSNTAIKRLQRCFTEEMLFTESSSREREREREREPYRPRIPQSAERTGGTHSAWCNWPPEPELDRVVNGVPYRMDRIKCLGNAVVPQQFYPFFDAIVKVEEELWQKQAEHTTDPE